MRSLSLLLWDRETSTTGLKELSGAESYDENNEERKVQTVNIVKNNQCTRNNK